MEQTAKQVPEDSDRLVGELLLERHLINEEDLQRALALQKNIGGLIGALLIRIGAISEEAYLPVLAAQLGMPILQATDLPHDLPLLAEWLNNKGVPLDWWLDQEVLAWEQPDGSVCCVARNPLDNGIAEVIERVFPHRELVWRLARTHDLDHALDGLGKANAARQEDHGDSSRLRELAEEAPVIEFVSSLVAQALDQRASDIHIEPEKHRFGVRFRIDGVLYHRFTLPQERFSAIVSRIKLISGMDIAEHRLPQDGQMETRVSGEEVDIRVSALPGVHGESVVMRLLPKEQKAFHLDGLGLSPDSLDRIQEWISEPHGIILVTGPTGSGKSTTLYSVLEEIRDGKKKIITVEDPVEYRLPGITQVQTQDAIEYTFARALRAILRQDPDVVMIGEIRDYPTAEIAIQASLTGHLVLSTLHTNDASSAFTRLIDMGVEPFLVATPVRAVMAQRLVRRLCEHCAEPAEPVAEVVEITARVMPEALRSEPARWSNPVGCEHCHGTGFSGRIGIHELIGVTPEIQSLILNGATLDAIRAASHSRDLREDGYTKAYQGITSVEEVLRVTAS